MTATPYPKISLCMIAKNEEAWIEQCIKSVSSIIWEIILVDTGSTDNTVERAKSLGAKVFHFEWTNHFAQARNYSISKALGDWILVLDADEVIAERDLKELQRLTLDRTKCYEFLQRHYSEDQRMSQFIVCKGEYPEWEKNYSGYFTSNLCRLFPNEPGIYYSGRVHELAEHSIVKKGAHQIVRTEIPIHHYGHTDEVKKKKDKSKLYSPLGNKKATEQKNDWKAFFELGVENNCNGRPKEAVESFLRSLELYPAYKLTWINLGYVLCELGKFREAEAALYQAVKLDPEDSEAYCNLGVVYLRTKNYQKAEAIFSKALEINPHYINVLCNLGKTYAMLGRASEAVYTLKGVLELMPKCTSAKIDLGVIYLNGGLPKVAERYIREAAIEAPTDPVVRALNHQLIAQKSSGY